MKIRIKLTIAFLFIAALVFIVGLVSTNQSQITLQEEIGESSVLLVQETLDKVDRIIYFRAEEVLVYFEDLILKEIISESNQKFDDIGNVQEYIDEKDKGWRAAEKDEITPFMQEIFNRRLSKKYNVLGFIFKPFENDQLVIQIKKYLGK